MAKIKQTCDVLWDMRKFAIHLAMTFEPIPADFDDSLEAWLAKTSYTEVDKQKFRDEIEERDYLKRIDRACKCFIKAETYPEIKFPRPIKSRTDRFKAKMGPIFQGINEQLFARTEYFIKKIPVNERPEFIKNKFGNASKFKCTDFSSFEAHFIDCIMFAIEWPLYMWMTKDLPNATEFRKELETLLRRNVCKFIDFVIDCMSRASGEMNTSSGNGWVNLVIFLYITTCKKALIALGLFEGDDGVTTTTPDSSSPTTKDFEDLGWLCKVIDVDKFEEASFCGIVAHEDDLINVCDIRAYIADFGWTRQQYLNANNTTIMALLRAKGYSAVYQYPGCPIIDALGHYALRVTDHDFVRKKMNKMLKEGRLADSRYKNHMFVTMFETMKHKRPERIKTPMQTRLLVERMFNIPVSRQLEIETYLDELNEITPLNIDIDVPDVWRYNTETFVASEIYFEVASHRFQLERDLAKIGA